MPNKLLLKIGTNFRREPISRVSSKLQNKYKQSQNTNSDYNNKPLRCAIISKAKQIDTCNAKYKWDSIEAPKDLSPPNFCVKTSCKGIDPWTDAELCSMFWPPEALIPFVVPKGSKPYTHKHTHTDNTNILVVPQNWVLHGGNWTNYLDTGNHELYKEVSHLTTLWFLHCYYKYKPHRSLSFSNWDTSLPLGDL